MLIEVEVTPNPATLRFLLPSPLPLGKPVAFGSDARRRPRIADRLLCIAGVKDVLLAREFVAVSRDSSAPDWSELRGDVVMALMEALEADDDAELEIWAKEEVASATTGDPIEKQIVDILRARIAPAVGRDGGSITLVSYRDGVAIVEMRGACGGCPSALMTLKRSVEATLKRYVPELERVEAEQKATPHKPFWKTMLEARGARFRA
jgi:Fe-S cluster biogenesis protein NfuA